MNLFKNILPVLLPPSCATSVRKFIKKCVIQILAKTPTIIEKCLSTVQCSVKQTLYLLYNFSISNLCLTSNQ